MTFSMSNAKSVQLVPLYGEPHDLVIHADPLPPRIYTPVVEGGNGGSRIAYEACTTIVPDHGSVIVFCRTLTLNGDHVYIERPK